MDGRAARRQGVCRLCPSHGTADKATISHGSEFFYETVGSKDRTLKLYDGHFHDLLNDYGKEQVIEDILGWIGSRL